MEKTPRILLIEARKRKPIEQVLDEMDAKHPRLESRASELGVSVVTYRAWRAAFPMASSTGMVDG